MQATEKEFSKSILDSSQMLRGLENSVQMYTTRKRGSGEKHTATITRTQTPSSWIPVCSKQGNGGCSNGLATREHSLVSPLYHLLPGRYPYHHVWFVELGHMPRHPLQRMLDGECLVFSAFIVGEFHKHREGFIWWVVIRNYKFYYSRGLLQLKHSLTIISFYYIVPSLKIGNTTFVFIKRTCLFKILNIQSSHYVCIKFNAQKI